MENLKTEELTSLKTDLSSLNSSLKALYPGLVQDPPDFKTYSHALNFLKSQYRLFTSKLVELHDSISSTRYGQQFFKVSQDLAQAKGKLKTREEAISKLRKENELLQRELSLMTGKVDSSSLLIENQSLKSKVFELQEELKVMKNLFQEQSERILTDEYIEKEETIQLESKVENTPRFMKHLEVPSPMHRSEVKTFFSPMKISPRSQSFTQDFPCQSLTSKKNSEVIIENFDSGDLASASSKWKEFNFFFLETATDRQNFDYLRKVLLYTLKFHENLGSSLNYDPSKPSEILKLEDENLKLRKKIAEKSNKLSSIYESQEAKKEENEEPQLEALKKLVYETSAHSIYLESQVSLIKSRLPSVPKLQESLLQGKASVFNDFIQGKILEELERAKSLLIENLRGALLQISKEKTDLLYESLTFKFRADCLEKLLEEERQMKRLLKSSKGISGIENWKAYKRDYLTRVELAYKTEIKELNDTIQRLKNELKITSNEMEERYIKEVQELTAKLRKEHQDKKKLAELLSKSRNIRQEEIIEQKYADSKEALQESNKKIYVLEQESFKIHEQNQELLEKLEKLEENVLNLAEEKEKVMESLEKAEKSAKIQENQKKKLETELFQLNIEKQNQILELQKSKESLQSRVNLLETSVSEAEFKRKEVEHATLSKITENSKELQEVREKFQRGKEKKRLSLIQVQKTQEDIEKINEELLLCKEDLETKSIQLSELKQEKETQVKESKILSSKLQDSIKTIESLRQEVKNSNLNFQSIEKKLIKTEEKFEKMEEKFNGEKENFLSKIEFLETVLEEKQQEILQKEKEIKSQRKEILNQNEVLEESISKTQTLEDLEGKNQELRKICEGLRRSKDLLASQIKEFYQSFCKENKIETPLLSKDSDDMLYEIYMHLISLCRTLNTSQHHIDISFEEPQATNDDYKLKYNELISKNALTRIEDSKKVLEKLKEAKNFQKIENLQDWVLEKWNATIDECEKLRQQLTLANQELDQQVKKDSSAYLEKAKDDFQNYKQDLEKQNKEILNCHARNSGLINELEFLKQEKYDMEKIMYQKVAKAESEMNELRDCFFDLFSQVNKNTKKSFSPDEMRNEIFSFINQIERKDKEIERTLSENNSLAQIAEKYVQDLEKMLKENNSLVQVNEKYAKEIARLNEECEYLERNLRDSSEVVKENLLLRNKFSELIDEKEYLENKLNYIQNELLPTSMHEDKTIREALENELLGKCELVKQLAEEIEKFKKFIKVRECEYQELLTLKDEEILRMRLRSS